MSFPFIYESLQTIVHNSEMNLDMNFKASIINDVLRVGDDDSSSHTVACSFTGFGHVAQVQHRSRFNDHRELSGRLTLDGKTHRLCDCRHVHRGETVL